MRFELFSCLCTTGKYMTVSEHLILRKHHIRRCNAMDGGGLSWVWGDLVGGTLLTLPQYNTEEAASSFSVLGTFHSRPLSYGWVPLLGWTHPRERRGLCLCRSVSCHAISTKRVVTYSGQQHNALIDLCSRRRECGTGHSDHPQLTLCHTNNTRRTAHPSISQLK